MFLKTFVCCKDIFLQLIFNEKHCIIKHIIYIFFFNSKHYVWNLYKLIGNIRHIFINIVEKHYAHNFSENKFLW